MERDSTRPGDRFDPCCPSPDVFIFHEFRLEADAHSLSLLQRRGLRPGKEEGAVDCFGCTRSIGKAYAFGEIRIEPHHDPMASPGPLDDPLEIASNIGVFNARVVQRGPKSAPGQQLGWTHADLLSVVYSKRPSRGKVLAQRVLVP